MNKFAEFEDFIPPLLGGDAPEYAKRALYNRIIDIFMQF